MQQAFMSSRMNFFSRLLNRLRSLPRIRLRRPLAVVLDWGKTNTVLAPGKMIATVRLRGSDNLIEMDRSSCFTGHITVQGNANRIIIGKNCRLAGEILVKGNKQTVTIGDRTTFVSVYLLCMENKDITIGRHCMFSRDIEIRTSDAHALIDNKKRVRLNPAASVKIGDHVWVGVGAVISKGTVIADDSVVGAKSFVNKTFEEGNVVIGGTPAKIIRRGVTWDRGRKQRYTREWLDAWRQPPEDN
jgi:acetyltransferase-like isoleucine patch superfamily enzyme